MQRKKPEKTLKFRENPLRAKVLAEITHPSVLTEEEQCNLERVAEEIAEFERRLGHPSRPSLQRTQRLLRS